MDQRGGGETREMSFGAVSDPYNLELKDVEGARVVSSVSNVDAGNTVNKPVPKETKEGSILMLVE
jgi:hypothetical protein